MSYNINCGDPFISTKLTEIGREKLAKGRLNFSQFAIGDSEINYTREDLLGINNQLVYSGDTAILRPKDNQPNIKSFISKESLINGGDFKYQIEPNNIRVLKVTVNNEATERGFFSGSTNTNWNTLTDDRLKYYEEVSNTVLDGTNILVLDSSATYDVGDMILIKMGNDEISGVTPHDNTEPLPCLWFKIQESSTPGELVLDRELPDLSGIVADSWVYIYSGGEVYENFGSNITTAYWDIGTLSFTSGCDVSVNDVPVWNMNIPYSESILGVPATNYETYLKYGSHNFIGQKNPYFGFNVLPETEEQTVASFCVGESIRDLSPKSIAILHYTNKTISNFYGEFFHIEDDKLTKIHIPTIMYHNRYFSGGTASGNVMGMSFVSDTTKKTIENTDIEYYDLIEDETLIASGNNPLVVGRVFPKLKMVIITDDEINTAMSYKSNRNWTLPSLELALSSPNIGAGVLGQNQTVYVTYMLESTSRLTTGLPCQYYAKIKNNTASGRDIQFKLEGIDKLPYMRKLEDVSYDGRGFYADKFKVLYQIVNDDERPVSDGWLEYDFTTSGMTNGGTIDPTVLENQIPLSNGFLINEIVNTGSTNFDLSNYIDIPLNIEPEKLQFGDERFFYGNLETYIGARIFKTIFEIRLNSAEYKFTNNTTKPDNPNTNIRVSEVGIYDSDGDLVVIGKLSTPIELKTGKVLMIELSLDF